MIITLGFFLKSSKTSSNMCEEFTFDKGRLRDRKSYWSRCLWRSMCCKNARFRQSICNEDTQQVGDVEKGRNSLFSGKFI